MTPFASLLPTWLVDYPRRHLRDDLSAGLIVTLLVLPQSLAYALLAGLPPQFGLYASIFPVIAYALLGSSRVQAVGPVAITAIMTLAVLAPLAPPGSPEYLVLAATLSLLSGLLLLAFGTLRLGFLSQLLSRPVINGFLAGSAILIVITQAGHLVGVAQAGHAPLAIVEALAHKLGANGWTPTLTIGLTSLAALAGARSLLPTLLRHTGITAGQATFIVRLVPLLVILAATLAVIRNDLDTHFGVAVVGPIAAGLPGFQVFVPSPGTVQRLLIPALLLALIGMVQNISMAQALAVKRRERVDANQELIGLGAANLVAAFYGGMPVGGGVSRSAVNVAAGAQTPLAGIVSALTMIAVVAGTASWFARMPLAALAASIIVAAASMVDLKALRDAWNYDRADAAAYLGTALGVLLLGLERGIGLGILLSLATLLLRASSPHIAVLGRLPASEHFRNVERYSTETIPGVLLLRIDESLFFGNLAAVEARLTQELTRAPLTCEVVLIMSAVNRVDTTAMETLNDLNRDLAERGVRLHLAEVKGPLHDRLARSPLWRALSGRVFLSVNDAFESLLAEHGVPPELHAARLPPG